jgi:hypothetical protein
MASARAGEVTGDDSVHPQQPQPQPRPAHQKNRERQTAAAAASTTPDDASLQPRRRTLRLTPHASRLPAARQDSTQHTAHSTQHTLPPHTAPPRAMDDFNSDTDSDYTSYWRDWVRPPPAPVPGACMPPLKLTCASSFRRGGTSTSARSTRST